MPANPRTAEEKPIRFDCGGKTLRGMLHLPAGRRAGGAAVVFLHGWSGCRLGPHRMFVKTARRLAAGGYACLRFDFAGRGESDGDSAAATIRSMIADAGAAIAFVRRETAAARLVLLGICSGGKVAIGATAEAGGVDGLVLWSAEPMGHLRSAGTGARKSVFALRQYAGKLLSPATWAKILAGRVNVRLVRKAVIQHEAPDADEIKDESARLDRFRASRCPVLLVYGTNDPDTKRAAGNYSRFFDEMRIDHEFHPIEGANHSFYSLEWEREVIRLTEAWLAVRFPALHAPA